MREQAFRFQMVVHVEGVGGWADQLRHLLTSGMVVLKQDAGVTEWWEVLLKPWVHYVPIDSALANLSHAVLWVRHHTEQARRIAKAGAELVEDVLSSSSLVRYTRSLLQGYVHFLRHSHVVRDFMKQMSIERPLPAWATRVNCSPKVPANGPASIECAFAAIRGAKFVSSNFSAERPNWDDVANDSVVTASSLSMLARNRFERSSRLPTSRPRFGNRY